jgi:PEP-CTERM motif
MKAVIPASDARRLTSALLLLLAASAVCSTSFAQTITETTALPPANDLVAISGEYSDGNIPGAYTYGDGSFTQSGVLPNGTVGTSTAILSQTGATAQVTNTGFGEAVANYYLMITGPGSPGSTVQLTLSNALLSTSGVNTSISYGDNPDYQLVASLSIVQATPADVYANIVSGSAPINGSLNLNGTYTVTTGEPIYIQERALAIYAYNGSTNVFWSASVDPVISLSSSVANPGAYTFAYSEGAPIFAVPEPSTYLMMLAGLGVLAGVARGRRRERGVLRLAA